MPRRWLDSHSCVVMVYVVRALAGEASGLVKIGCTSKFHVPDCRLREIASSRLVRGPIDVLWGKVATQRLERELHEWFASSRHLIGGEREWFSLHDDDLGLLLAIDSDLPRGVLTPRLRKADCHAADDARARAAAQRGNGSAAT